MAHGVTWSVDHCEPMVAMTQSSDGWICLEGSGTQRANDPSFVVVLFVGYINTCAVYFAGSLALGHAE